MKKRKDLRIGLLQLLVFDGEFAAPMLPARAVGRASRRPSARAARLVLAAGEIFDCDRIRVAVAEIDLFAGFARDSGSERYFSATIFDAVFDFPIPRTCVECASIPHG